LQVLTSVLLSSPNISVILSISSTIIATILSGLDKISFKSVININLSDNSSSIFCLSSQANLFNFISRIASA
jgi:hypothetical protein